MRARPHGLILPCPARRRGRYSGLADEGDIVVRLARGLGIVGGALLLAIPFIASAQEDRTSNGTELITVTDDDATGGDDAPRSPELRPEPAPPADLGPSTSDGADPVDPAEPLTGAESDAADDRPARVGPSWWNEPYAGEGRPPWAGGPKKAERAGADSWRPGDGPPPWSRGDDDEDVEVADD